MKTSTVVSIQAAIYRWMGTAKANWSTEMYKIQNRLLARVLTQIYTNTVYKSTVTLLFNFFTDCIQIKLIIVNYCRANYYRHYSHVTKWNVAIWLVFLESYHTIRYKQLYMFIVFLEQKHYKLTYKWPAIWYVHWDTCNVAYLTMIFNICAIDQLEKLFSYGYKAYFLTVYWQIR